MLWHFWDTFQDKWPMLWKKNHSLFSGNLPSWTYLLGENQSVYITVIVVSVPTGNHLSSQYAETVKFSITETVNFQMLQTPPLG